ncbi:hypothetical protein [Fuerstiella marisgermanici]|uniref:Uncharacterized protein n=1 Tax=Fuerstiella marisgermanici TaxID=1891926 RepID=A0A1P8WKM9_9PLAN|nr:hypothetical protein [Fuerstiella marisgermanici]APZ94610.1 hypothetical protein Fuma_04243 [Fuerstiella marisgermanici]
MKNLLRSVVLVMLGGVVGFVVAKNGSTVPDSAGAEPLASVQDGNGDPRSLTDEQIWRIDQNVTQQMESPAIYRTSWHVQLADGSYSLTGVTGIYIRQNRRRSYWLTNVQANAAGEVTSWEAVQKLPEE